MLVGGDGAGRLGGALPLGLLFSFPLLNAGLASAVVTNEKPSFAFDLLFCLSLGFSFDFDFSSFRSVACSSFFDFSLDFSFLSFSFVFLDFSFLPLPVLLACFFASVGVGQENR